MMNVPFFRPDLTQLEIDEVVDTLKSGWLTSGPRVKQFEEGFASAVGAKYAVAVNSATAALHLALEAMGLKAGQGVLVPTLTFAATAEVVCHLGAHPILVDCDASTLNMDLGDAEKKIRDLRARRLSVRIPPETRVVGMIPVHVGGLMMDMQCIREFAKNHGLWVVEDAAHAFPAAWRKSSIDPWIRCGEGTADVSCFSFYANKTITTGEGGMAVTDNELVADRIRIMSLHGLSQDAWERYRDGHGWDYQIVAPGFKYNLTDIAAAIGIHQLARAEGMRRQRERIVQTYIEELGGIDGLERPNVPENRIHSWHLLPIRLQLDRLTVDRNSFMNQLQEAGIGCSVHWRPLHLHPFYLETYCYKPEDFRMATREWQRVISLPLFPSMSLSECEYVISTLRGLCQQLQRAA